MSFRIVCRPPGENPEGRLHSHRDDKKTLPRAALGTFLAVHVEKKNSLKQLAERETWTDPDSLSESGVRHLKVEVQERTSGRS